MRPASKYAFVAVLVMAFAESQASTEGHCDAPQSPSGASTSASERALRDLARWVADRTGVADLIVPDVCVVSPDELVWIRHGNSAASSPLHTVALYSRQPPRILLQERGEVSQRHPRRCQDREE